MMSLVYIYIHLKIKADLSGMKRGFDSSFTSICHKLQGIYVKRRQQLGMMRTLDFNGNLFKSYKICEHNVYVG